MDADSLGNIARALAVAVQEIAEQRPGQGEQSCRRPSDGDGPSDAGDGQAEEAVQYVAPRLPVAEDVDNADEATSRRRECTVLGAAPSSQAMRRRSMCAKTRPDHHASTSTGSPTNVIKRLAPVAIMLISTVKLITASGRPVAT